MISLYHDKVCEISLTILPVSLCTTSSCLLFLNLILFRFLLLWVCMFGFYLDPSNIGKICLIQRPLLRASGWTLQLSTILALKLFWNCWLFLESRQQLKCYDHSTEYFFLHLASWISCVSFFLSSKCRSTISSWFV